MSDIIAHFVFERSTNGAHRYQEVDSHGSRIFADLHNATIGPAIYIRKSAIGEKAPPEIEVTVRVIHLL